MFIKGFIFTIGAMTALVAIIAALFVAKILGVLIRVSYWYFYDLFNPADTKPNRLKEKYEGSTTN